jgi:hypothetical protein
MLSKYLVSYYYPHDYTKQIRYDVFTAGEGGTWRELQKVFDPHYRYDYLKFYNLGSEIKFVQGE